jgi:hypothetical protein
MLRAEINLPASFPTTEEIFSKVATAVFGYPIVENLFRGFVAEAIVAAAIEPDWRWKVREGGPGWDFEHSSGCRIEVKQSAKRQIWVPAKKRHAPSFDIRQRKGHWVAGVDGEPSKYIERSGRSADIYIFAYHPIAVESAEQRDARQWRFYLLPTACLPDGQDEIALSKLITLGAEEVGWSDLRAAVERLRRRLEAGAPTYEMLPIFRARPGGSPL